MKKSLFGTAYLVLLSLQAFANPVYRNAPEVSTKSPTLYTSKPQFENQPPATLPPIIKSDNFFAAKSPVGCAKHGGVNCLAGADRDGSVVCHDGFADSPARFNLTCSGSKLVVTEISPIQDKGAKVTVRNITGMKATKIKVYANLNGKKEFISGADEIDSFGSSDYIYVSERQLTETDFKHENFSVTCGNCPNQ